jgi:hypothetical protein
MIRDDSNSPAKTTRRARLGAVGVGGQRPWWRPRKDADAIQEKDRILHCFGGGRYYALGCVLNGIAFYVLLFATDQ